MKTAVVLTVAVLANSLGAVCLSKGMKQWGPVEGPAASGIWRVALHGLTSPWVILGILLLMVFLACYLAALSWADLSFVLPATAPGYVLTAFFSKIFLQEAVSPARWAGTFLIVAGTWLVARTYASRAVPGQGSMATAARPPEFRLDPRAEVSRGNSLD